MTNRFFVAVTVAFIVGITPSVTLARGNGGGPSGGKSSSHISDQGLLNTNGPNSTDRDTGLDRASDRMSTKGLSNTNSANSTTRSKGQNRAKNRGHKKGGNTSSGNN